MKKAKKEEKRGRGRPPITVDRKATRSVRVRPSEKLLIEERYGTIQSFFESKVKEEFGGVHEAEVEFKNKKSEKLAHEEISEDDF